MSTWDDKPNDYEHALIMLEQQRNAVIEECARVAELKKWHNYEGDPNKMIADAIRALKSKAS